MRLARKGVSTRGRAVYAPNDALTQDLLLHDPPKAVEILRLRRDAAEEIEREKAALGGQSTC